MPASRTSLAAAELEVILCRVRGSCGPHAGCVLLAALGLVQCAPMRLQIVTGELSCRCWCGARKEALQITTGAAPGNIVHQLSRVKVASLEVTTLERSESRLSRQHQCIDQGAVLRCAAEQAIGPSPSYRSGIGTPQASPRARPRASQRWLKPAERTHARPCATPFSAHRYTRRAASPAHLARP